MNHLIECPVIKQYEELLSQPANQAIGNLKFKNSELKKANENLRAKIAELQESNAKLYELPDELKKELKAVKAYSEKQHIILTKFKEWFADNGHPINNKETVIEKLDNMQAIINSQAPLIEVLNIVQAEHPEYVKELIKKTLDSKKQKDKSVKNPIGLATRFGGVI